MIGTRFWIPTIDIVDNKVEDFYLRSIYENYMWKHPSNGVEVSTLVEYRKPGTAGFHIPMNRYIDDEEVDTILPLLWEEDDPRWDDEEEWFNYFKDYVVWSWCDEWNHQSPYFGFSAFKKFEDMSDTAMYLETSSPVLGIISGHGKIHEYSFGFFSEYMEILGLYLDPSLDKSHLNFFDSTKESWEWSDKLSLDEYTNILAESWEIPVLSFEEAMEMVDTHVYD